MKNQLLNLLIWAGSRSIFHLASPSIHLPSGALHIYVLGQFEAQTDSAFMLQGAVSSHIAKSEVCAFCAMWDDTTPVSGVTVVHYSLIDRNQHSTSAWSAFISSSEKQFKNSGIENQI